MKASRK